MTCWMWSLFNTCLWIQLWTVCDSSGKAQKGCILSVFEEKAAVLCQHFSLLYFDFARLDLVATSLSSLHGLDSWDFIYSMEYGDNERDTESYLKVQGFQATCAFCQQIKGLSGQQWEVFEKRQGGLCQSRHLLSIPVTDQLSHCFSPVCLALSSLKLQWGCLSPYFLMPCS